MGTLGTVRTWRHDEGWGVLDSEETPTGCWAHFSVLRMSGYKTLEVGQDVAFEFEAAEQDGYEFRAVRVWLAGSDPGDESSAEGPSAAYRSELRITVDPAD